jgi:hypothetical protein
MSANGLADALPDTDRDFYERWLPTTTEGGEIVGLIEARIWEAASTSRVQSDRTTDDETRAEVKED